MAQERKAGGRDSTFERPVLSVGASSHLRHAGLALLVAALYFGAAKLGLQFAFLHTNVSPVWPPSGLAIAAIVLLGYRVWPGILIGAFLANFFTPISPVSALGIGIGNTLEAVCGGAILHRLHFHPSFRQAIDVLKFLVTVIVCTTLSATIGTLSLWFSNSAVWDGIGSLWLTWWLGDLTGALIVAPLILTWATETAIWPPRGRTLEAVLLLLLLSVAAIATFGESSPAPIHYYPLTRLIVPFLLWASLRLRTRTLTLAIALVSAFAIWGTAHGSGPFIGPTPNESLMILQLFVGSNAVTFLFLVAVVGERRNLYETRQQNEQRLAANLAVTRILAESSSLNAAIPRILETICQRLNWQFGSMWMLEKDWELHLYSSCTTPNQNLQHFEAATKSRSFSRGVGLPGRVMSGLKPTWIVDVGKDTNFPRAPSALEDGLRSAFAFPIFIGERFIGVMEFFSSEIREPDAALLAMFDSIGGQIGQFIERSRAEDALRQSEKELSEFFDNAPEAIHWVAEDGTILRVNEAELVMMGYTREEYVGRNIKEFHVDQGTIDDILARLRRGEIITDYTAQMRCKDGSIKDVQVNSGVYFEDGQFIHSRCFTRDVTEQNRAEKALRQLAAIVESTDDAIIGHDLNGVITSWNAAAEKLYGYQAEEILGLPVTVLIPPERPEDHAAMLPKLRRGERIDHLETVRVTKDGNRIDVSLTVSPVLDREGNVVGASKIARDITERKQAEREREQLLNLEQAARSQAEVANRVKDEFLATLSHELRTPLNAILGWASLLQGNRLSDDEIKRAIEVIHRNAKAQSQLIEGVLDVSRIVSGKLVLDPEPVELQRVVQAAVDSIRPAASARNISVVTEYGADENRVLGDANRLQQIIWNLLSNAVKFSSAGGEVSVQLRRVGPNVEVVVRDDGEGISPEFLPFVFDRFRQADSSTTRRHGGLGLGLAIVRHLVELHGGTVNADSKGAGQGAQFTVSLPLAGRAPKSPDPSSETVTNELEESQTLLSRLKILVIDDEADARELLLQMLTNCNAEVKASASADEAREVLTDWQPDVLVSDISMPGIDGYSFIRAVRGGASNGNVPAISLTAHAREGDRQKALAAGFQDHLSKPVQLRALVRSIARLTGRLKEDDTC